ncbi:MAG: DNA repair protein RecN [Phycisphaerales bacterium]|nr:DNA repair protein RecN [Phycisphaerales bacterium]
MLRELHIQNLAVIQDITIELCPHLNCFTGQTGAGKSLIIGALEILLALRQPTDMLRKGAVEGRVSAVFHVESPHLRQELAVATDLPVEQEPELIIARRIFESGRTSASLNGHPITGTMLKQVGEILVDVHGQHDAQFLLKPANQLAVLDDFGGSTEMRREFAELHRQRQELFAQQQELAASRTLRRQQLELYEFQAKEIDDAIGGGGGDANEHETLTARSRVLANAEKIKRQAAGTYAALYEEEGAIIERLKVAMAALMELAEMDESLGSLATQVKEATVSLDDAAFSLRRYVDRLDLDPAEMAEVTERLNLLNRLIDKYGGRTAGAGLQDVLAYREQIGRQIAELKEQDQDLSASAESIAKLEERLREIGGKLTAARKKAAGKLVPLIHEQLADLGMKEAEFKVEFMALTNDFASAQSPGTAVPGLDHSTSSGFEAVEFMIAPNPGQPARPLRRIASGGELSRVMLALKSILAQRGGADRVSVLVFDEVDANVGGRMGSVIGKKLRALAAIHQVLCITHLPQIAAFADRHLTIRKATSKGQTTTTVTVMEGEARLAELAEMTVGSGAKSLSETSLAQAKELLEAARGKKGVRS